MKRFVGVLLALLLTLVVVAWGEELVIEGKEAIAQEIDNFTIGNDEAYEEVIDNKTRDNTIANDNDDFEIIGTKLVGYYGPGGNVVIPYGIKIIGEGVFQDNLSVTGITIPSSVESIEELAFEGCNGLVSITIPGTVKNIGDYAFRWCDRLTHVDLSYGISSLGDQVFMECTSLANIVIPGSIQSIGGCLFSGCSGLTSVVFQEGCSTIGEYMFEDCTSLSNVTLAKSIQNVGKWAFYQCSGLYSINIPGINVFDYMFDKCTNLTNVNIEEGTIVIGEAAFSECNIRNITLPSTVNTILKSAFLDCSKLTDITIHCMEKMNIGIYAFDGCDSLRTFHTRCGSPVTKWAQDEGYNVDVTGHIPTADKAIAPTYIASGLTAGSHCAVCGDILQEQKVVPKLVTKKIKLNKKKATLTKGKTLQLKVTFTPAHKTSKYVALNWWSSDEDVATVSAKGKVKAVDVGKATITVETTNGKKATCKITVKAKK